MSLPEVLLWRELKKRSAGLKFRRQHPFRHYILDFYCDVAKLVVEIDGEAHDRGDNPARDGQRDDWLRSQGLGVLRIPAKEVLTNLDDVLRHIIASITEAANPPPPGEGDREAVEGET
jgi:very-short-patch-repair endonuclease